MRYLILIASLALAGTALAEEKPTSVAKELDKSSPSLMTSDDASGTTDSSATRPRDAASGMATGKRQHGRPTADGGGSSGASGGTRAQDYNSSRSNNINGSADGAGDLDRDGRVDIVTCGRGVDDDCDDTGRAASPANHNTTRSNRAPAENHNSTRSNRARAENYNSTRSNKASPRMATDSDGDSDLREVRCSMASDDCVSDAAGGDGNDLVLRKRPGKK
jgi:hypothetical protein